MGECKLKRKKKHKRRRKKCVSIELLKSASVFRILAIVTLKNGFNLISMRNYSLFSLLHSVVFFHRFSKKKKTHFFYKTIPFQCHAKKSPQKSDANACFTINRKHFWQTGEISINPHERNLHLNLFVLADAKSLFVLFLFC